MSDDNHLDPYRFENLPPEKWPKLEFEWDLKFESQRYSLGSITPQRFDTEYSDGFCLGEVSLEELHGCLHDISRRRREEIWTVGKARELSRVIDHIARGQPITPPLIALHIGSKGKLYLTAGNHRYTVAVFSEQDRIPVYALPEEKEEIDKILKVDWC